VVAALISACNASDSAETLRLGHGLAVDHPVHLAMVEMAEELGRSSGGALRMTISPGEQLGTERQSVELLQIGSLDLTKTSAAVLEGFDPAFGVFTVPYLFEDEDAAMAAVDGALGAALARRLEAIRLVPLAWYRAGSRSFYTIDRPIRAPDDLAGLPIRTQESAAAMRMVTALGAKPTPIAWGELYTALQQGIVAGAENNPPSLLRSRHFEVARHYSLDEHTIVPDVVLIAKSTWDRLGPDDREALRRAARHAETLQRHWWGEATEEALRELEAAGVMLHCPDKTAFAERVTPLREAAAADPVLGPLLGLIAERRRDSVDPRSPIPDPRSPRRGQ
jgi:tripartite ATP-independent transporter DctP family solute receptor